MGLNVAVASSRAAIIQSDDGRLLEEMANTLVAAIKFGGLNTANTADVIRCLWDAPERYNRQAILNNYEGALYDAKQTLIAMEMTDR